MFQSIVYRMQKGVFVNRKIILVAETGSDISRELADQLGVFLVPMHVSMGEQTLDDGTFPPEEVCAYYDRTGKTPQTSASGPADFEQIFDTIHAQYPQAQILHLAYSAVTTCSYQNARLAAAERNYVTSVDTQHVSVGQGVVVRKVAQFLHEQPDLSIEAAAEAARQIAQQVHMCFVPDKLDYLRAGGRVSNVVALTGNLLGLHPCIEILDGKLMARKKYRGAIAHIIPKLISDFSEKFSLKKDELYLIETPRLSDAVRKIAEESAHACGFSKVEWVKTGCVITCHSGPNAFGIVGLSK